MLGRVTPAMLVVPARSESAIAIWARLPLDRPTGFQVIIYIEVRDV
ncbi:MULTISPECIES: hypothetical protein [Limnospira]|uniref:Uncharacterized protein n=1 Tax=Limnospira fusiformis PMC 851.14 TaxID=2219512 RepID=A0ABU9EKF7_LIMFS|nr:MULTISPECIES: hypothetical protein [unclassified Limnospira]MDT9196839.1 hypothetical protein [Limnospira sp. PMC 1042.18]MDT9233121.1 hypothetical protein [Limnospira sp. PMC 917.15]MDY7052434.1 hypothetical protein [Limnospira fusiformis LS22]